MEYVHCTILSFVLYSTVPHWCVPVLYWIRSNLLVVIPTDFSWTVEFLIYHLWTKGKNNARCIYHWHWYRHWHWHCERDRDLDGDFCSTESSNTDTNILLNLVFVLLSPPPTYTHLPDPLPRPPLLPSHLHQLIPSTCQRPWDPSRSFVSASVLDSICQPSDLSRNQYD